MEPWVDDDLDDGSEPWALGDDDPEPLEQWPVDGDVADRWLDEQLGRLRPSAGDDGTAQASGLGHLHGSGERGSDAGSLGGAAPVGTGGGGVVLRCPAPGRAPRRRRADPDAAADLPAPDVPGYVRDRRGTWRYAATGRAVPGARDLTLRSLHRFPVQRGGVLVPVDLVRSEAELAWCLAWKHTLTTRLAGGHVATVLRVPLDEWDRRADIPFGLWAPELSAGRMLAPADVARLAGVTAATVTAYLSRNLMPPPVRRLGHTPVWSRPVIHQWLATRPGMGRARASP
jgi:hypothetical protein